MYVIEDKKGRFWSGVYNSGWVRSLQKATRYRDKICAIENCNKANGERVFEVELVLGKQVK